MSKIVISKAQLKSVENMSLFFKYNNIFLLYEEYKALYNSFCQFKKIT